MISNQPRFKPLAAEFGCHSVCQYDWAAANAKRSVFIFTMWGHQIEHGDRYVLLPPHERHNNPNRDKHPVEWSMSRAGAKEMEEFARHVLANPSTTTAWGVYIMPKNVDAERYEREYVIADRLFPLTLHTENDGQRIVATVGKPASKETAMRRSGIAIL